MISKSGPLIQTDGILHYLNWTTHYKLAMSALIHTLKHFPALSTQSIIHTLL